MLCIFLSLKGDKTSEEGSRRRKSYDLNTFPLNACLMGPTNPKPKVSKKAGDDLEYRWHSAAEFHGETAGYSEKANYSWKTEAVALYYGHANKHLTLASLLFKPVMFFSSISALC